MALMQKLPNRPMWPRRMPFQYDIELVSALSPPELRSLAHICDRLWQMSEKPSDLFGWLAASAQEVLRQRQDDSLEPGTLELPRHLYAERLDDFGEALTSAYLLRSVAETEGQANLLDEILADLCHTARFFLIEQQKRNDKRQGLNI